MLLDHKVFVMWYALMKEIWCPVTRVSHGQKEDF